MSWFLQCWLDLRAKQLASPRSSSFWLERRRSLTSEHYPREEYSSNLRIYQNNSGPSKALTYITLTLTLTYHFYSLLYQGELNYNLPKITFERGGIDSFVMTTRKSLGSLQYLRIWHDNTGIGDFASWFLGAIIIRDLQTGEKYQFANDRWLAVEYGDGEVGYIYKYSLRIW